MTQEIKGYTGLDYIRFDEIAAEKQAKLKSKFLDLIAELEAQLPANAPTAKAFGREKAICITQLEHAYARVGRAVRDDQVARGIAELQEGRSNE